MGALFATWPGPAGFAAIGVTLAVAAAVAFLLDRRGWVLTGLAGLAVASMLVEGAMGTIHAWLTPVAFVVALHTVLTDREDPKPAWARTAGLVGLFAILAAIAALWRPIQASLVGPEGVLVAISLMGAASMAIVLWATTETDESFVQQG